MRTLFKMSHFTRPFMHLSIFCCNCCDPLSIGDTRVFSIFSVSSYFAHNKNILSNKRLSGQWVPVVPLDLWCTSPSLLFHFYDRSLRANTALTLRPIFSRIFRSLFFIFNACLGSSNIFSTNAAEIADYYAKTMEQSSDVHCARNGAALAHRSIPFFHSDNVQFENQLTFFLLFRFEICLIRALIHFSRLFSSLSCPLPHIIHSSVGIKGRKISVIVTSFRGRLLILLLYRMSFESSPSLIPMWIS